MTTAKSTKPTHRAVFTGRKGSIGVGFLNKDAKGINVQLNVIPKNLEFDLIVIDESTIVDVPAGLPHVAFDAFVVTEYESEGAKKSIWTKIGTASWNGNTTQRLNIDLQGMPTENKFVLREHRAQPAVGEQMDAPHSAE